MKTRREERGEFRKVEGEMGNVKRGLKVCKNRHQRLEARHESKGLKGVIKG